MKRLGLFLLLLSLLFVYSRSQVMFIVRRTAMGEWAPKTGVLTLLDTACIKTEYKFPYAIRVGVSDVVAIAYSDADDDIIVETRSILGDVIGDTINTWTVLSDPDGDDPVYFGKLLSIEDSNNRYMIALRHTGNTQIPGYGEGVRLVALITFGIASDGEIDTTSMDTLIYNYTNSYVAAAYRNDFDVVHVRDSLYALFRRGLSTTHRVEYASFVATSDTIYANQDLTLSSAGYVGSGYVNFTAIVHNDHPARGESNAILCKYERLASLSGYTFKTYMNSGDTLSLDNDTHEWGGFTSISESIGIDRIYGTEYYVALYSINNGVNDVLRVRTFEGDTTSESLTKAAIDTWIDIGIGHNDASSIYVQNSDSLFYNTSVVEDSIYSYVTAVNRSTGVINQSLIDSIRVVCIDTYDHPYTIYINRGKFLSVYGTGTNGMIALFEMD